MNHETWQTTTEGQKVMIECLLRQFEKRTLLEKLWLERKTVGWEMYAKNLLVGWYYPIKFVNGKCYSDGISKFN